LLAAHWFLFHTWIAFWSAPGAATVLAVRAVVLVLAFSFVFASLLSFRFSNPLVDFFYRCAAIWLGFLNYLFFAACLSWLVWYAVVALQLGFNPAVVRPFIFVALSAAGVLAGVFGVINRRWIRVREVTVALAGLPESWRGRRAVLMSDLHLGNINRVAFSRRIVEMTARLKPDIVFIPGDLYDGGEANLDALVEPFSKLNAPLGIYFSSGNHEEFGGVEEKLGAISRAGIEILHNRKVTVDGLHIAGVPYGDSTSPIRLRATLERLALTPGEASILLNHMPSRLPIVERAGISLQLSGHTHGGQLFPFTWFTRRAFGRFTYGLQSFGSLQVYTSYGAGTWGPPMRLGTHSEIVLLQFE
jgi:hypothetical protein